MVPSIGDFIHGSMHPLSQFGKLTGVLLRGDRVAFFVVSLLVFFRSFRSFFGKANIDVFCFNVTSVIGLYFD